MVGLCTAILKSKNLPFLPRWWGGGEKGNFGDKLIVFKVTRPETPPSGTGRRVFEVSERFYLVLKEG